VKLVHLDFIRFQICCRFELLSFQFHGNTHTLTSYSTELMKHQHSQFKHIMPVLRQLHWLPVQQCIEYKMAILVYKSLNVLSPRYLMDDCQLVTTTGRRRLRSSNVAMCDVPRTCTSLDDQSFTAAGPRLWNNLPVHLQGSELTLLEFRRLLKTQLFS